MKRFTLISVMLVLFAFVASSCGEDVGKGSASKSATKAANADALKVEFYVMSQCPYGVQVENTVIPALKQLGNTVDFHLDYIVTETAPGQFKSLHGEPETQGNIVQLCAMKYNNDKFFDFLNCQNKNPRQIPGNWEECAKTGGLDVAKIKACKDGEEGKKLLSESAKRAVAAGAKGSPTIKVNGQDYKGGRKTNDFLRAFCNEMKGTKPEACNNIPEPPKVNLTVLNDARCTDCKTQESRLVANLKGIFGGLQVKSVDYSTDEGKKLYKDTGLKLLPAFLFDDSVSKDEEGSKRLARWLKPQGTYKSLAVGAKFDPTAEICDNKKDDTGNGKVDCADPTCQQDLLCRKEMKNKLDVFVMSQCPYGVKALNAMEEVLANFKGEIDFDINFIATKQGDGFKALHGQPEVDENIRELCAIKHYPKNYKYMDYILCRNKNIRSNEWQTCTGKNGIKTAVIEKCFTGGEGKKLLEENIKIGNGIGVTGSPTWLANNRYKFSGIDAETVKQNLCKYNKGLKGCENTLSKTNNSSAGGAKCGN